MENAIEIYSLIAVIIMLLIIVGRGSYEYLVNIPKWFAAPPVSFEVIRAQGKGSARFWIPVQLLFLISYFTALISNWNIYEVRMYITFAGLSYLVVIVSTAAYFVKEIMKFQKMPVNATWTEPLQKRVDLWRNTTVIRNILQVLSLILILIGTFKQFTL